MSILSEARKDLGKPGGLNTCVSVGIHAWAVAAGLPYPKHRAGYLDPRSSVSGLRGAVLDRKTANGWKYHIGMKGFKEGYVLDWASPSAHVTVIDDIRNGLIRSIGSGGPTNHIAYQPTTRPAGKGYNAPSMFRGYFIPPKKKPSKPVTDPASGGPVTPVTPPKPPKVFPRPPIVNRAHALGDTTEDGSTVRRINAGQAIYGGNYRLYVAHTGDLLWQHWDSSIGKYVTVHNFGGRGKKADEGSAYLIMQGDRNLVLYGDKHGHRIVLKSFRTNRRRVVGHATATAQADGNFVVTSHSGKILYTLKK